MLWTRRASTVTASLSCIAIAGMLAIAMTGCSNPVEDVVDDADYELTEMTGQETAGDSEAVGNEEDASEESGTPGIITAQDELASPVPLEISDYGWFAAESNMVNFSVMIENPNEHVTAGRATLTVTGFGEDGSEIFVEDITLANIAPESEYAFSYVTGNREELPSDIALSLAVDDEDWYIDEESAASYEVEGVSVIPSEIDGVDMIEGTVSSDESGTGQVMVNSILYDENGHMLGGYFDIVRIDGSEGQVFQTYLIDAPEYDSYRIFVSPYAFD